MEEMLKKSGPELFRELLRVYPVAELDDYHKMYKWQDDQMRIDLQLVHAHRAEAGAPDPTPLDEVKMPPLPQVHHFQQSSAAALLAARAAALQGVRPAGVTAAIPGASGAASGAGAELRLMALFVAKWKIDPTRTKMMLAKLQPQQRRYVIQNFKTTATGMPATDELQQFITECEEKESWPAASEKAETPAPASAVTAGARPATPGGALAASVRAASAGIVMPGVGGVKRPLVPGAAALGANKLVRPAGAGAVTPAATALRQKILAAQQAAGRRG
jgi:hypothetical protein